LRKCCATGAAYQKAVREQRLAAEISAAKRERDFYLSRVDKAKAIAAQQERKRKVWLIGTLHLLELMA
jgi:ribonucleotide monophosphatase NagD (HAD superfamily)